ncbi:putative IRON-SULFUR-BINDING REDUCTASE domain protein [Mycobacterium xenopi 3993]|nr:putative IRON-SULFUR-BINDING REDUCTASE domain protein [Mycobacterium xenopi 3993]
MLAFLIIVLHSKHLHIFLAPINVIFKRLPNGLGRCCPSRPTASRSTSKIRPRTPHSPRQDRGLHLEGHARLRHLHRMRRCQSQCRPGTPASR